SCGQHHAADIGFFGAERRVNGRAAPGYQMLLGGYIGQEQMHFAEKALRLPARNVPEAAARVIRRFASERTAGESFRSWMQTAGGVAVVAKDLKDLDNYPTIEQDPSFYVDYDETATFAAEIGESECAT
ncbi:MAG: nitrite/sulfite reductase, partial [Acidimicrobiales bacterium]